MRYISHIAKPGKHKRSTYLDDFLIKVQDIPEHPSYPKHTHDFSELVIVYEGYGINHVDGFEYPISAGDVFVIHAGQIHAYNESDHLHLINVLFDPAVIMIKSIDMSHLAGFVALFSANQQGVQPQSINCLHLKNDQLVKAKTIVEQLEKEIDSKKPGYRAISQSLLLLLIGKLSRWYDAPANANPFELMKIAKAVTYLEQKLYEPINMKKLARMANTSERNFYRIFNKATNMTPNQYLINLRLRQASDLLKFSNMSITEIAYECGFQDSSYLSKIFKKYESLTPREYRNKHQNN